MGFERKGVAVEVLYMLHIRWALEVVKKDAVVSFVGDFIDELRVDGP